VKYITLKNKVRKRKEKEGWKCKDSPINMCGGVLKKRNV